jgi:NAD(P)-dependent dehydrogenase (short-subunit alcohol dehydrogenase family)
MSGTVLSKTALVTGGTRGIGAAIAARFIAEGAAVTVTGTKPDGIGPPGTRYRALDFSDAEAVETLAAEMLQWDLDILVKNAGINKIGPFAEINPADFARIQEVNVKAPFRLCQAVLPGMRRKGWGRIVNIASIFGVISKEHRAAYSASKFALDGLTAALAAEVAADGILANCVSPGFIGTDLTRRVLGEEGIRDLVARVPIKRLGKPEEVAALVAWLAGEENTFISGQNIVIDGGFSRV